MEFLTASVARDIHLSGCGDAPGAFETSTLHKNLWVVTYDADR
jgi:hypothetical protein